MNKETRRFIAYGLLSVMFLIITARTAYRMESQRGLLHWDTVILIIDVWLLFRFANKFTKTIR